VATNPADTGIRRLALYRSRERLDIDPARLRLTAGEGTTRNFKILSHG